MKEEFVYPGYFDPRLTLQEIINIVCHFTPPDATMANVLGMYEDERGKQVDAVWYMMSNSIAQAVLRCVRYDQ